MCGGGEVWEKAVAYLHQTGIKAAARTANRKVVAYFEQALGALTHLPVSRDTLEQAIDLRFDLRASLFPLTELAQVLDHLREAEILAVTLGDQQRLGQVSAYPAQYFYIR
jgi:hypothetical protein